MLVFIKFCSKNDVMSRWGDEKTLRFIKLYRENECLWNIRSPSYKNKEARECAYNNILKKIDDKNMDMRSVKIKIKNLRSIYHTELKRVKYSLRRNPDGHVYTPSLTWFPAIHAFLGDFIEELSEFYGDSPMIGPDIETDTEQHQSPFKNDDGALTELVPKMEQDYEEAALQPQLEISKLPQIIVSGINSSPSSFQSPPSLSNSERTRKEARNLNRRNAPQVSVHKILRRLENTVSNIVNTTQVQQNVQREEDEFHIFGLSVAAQLRQLPLHTAIATQSRIQNLLTEVRISSIFSENLSQPSIINVKQENECDN